MIDYPKDLLEISKRFSSDREEVGIEEVLVLTDDLVLTQFVHDVFVDLEEKWNATHWTSEFGITEPLLRRYFITAVESRVKYVTRENPRVRTNDLWYLPAPFALVVNMLGVVDVESPVMRLMPKWNPEYDSELLTPAEFTALGLKLRKLEDDPDVKVILIHALEKDRRGYLGLMQLVPELDEVGQVVKVRSTAQIDSIAATCFLILGLRPSQVVQGIPAQGRRSLPPYYLPVNMTDMIRMVMAEIRGKQSS